MATTSTALMTWEEFEQLPDGDGFHRELIEGELQLLPPVKSGHSKVARRTYKALLRLEDSGLGQAYLEAGYKLAEDPATWIQSDASFLRIHRVLETDDSDYFLGPPDLAVEVVSASETSPKLQRKIELLLEHGCQAVLVLYPKTRKVRIHFPDGTSTVRGVKDKLDAPYLLPGWEFPVRKLFED